MLKSFISSIINPHGVEGKEAQLAASKFDDDEIHVLRMTWQDMADRNGGKGIDKDTFLQYFPLGGLLGERLFAQFDARKVGIINFDEFILGLSKMCRYVLEFFVFLPLRCCTYVIFYSSLI